MTEKAATSRPKRRPALVVSVHDVAPATAEQTSQWCADAANLGIPVSLLVIAGRWRGASVDEHPDFGRMLRAQVVRGNEVVLHAWTHAASDLGRSSLRLAVAPALAEFAALNETEAARRLSDGLGVLSAAGLRVDGFSPPGWLASPGAVAAADKLRLRYIATRGGLIHLHNGHKRSGLALGAGGPVGVRLAAAAARWAAARGRLVRIGLHPDDLRRPALRSAALRAIERVLIAGGEALTYGELART